MNRRGFMTAVAGGALVSGPAGLAAAGPALRARDGGAPLVATYVTNLTDALRDDDLGLAPGDAVTLRRLPERRYDPDGVGVLRVDGRLLGYLPAREGHVLAGLLRAGLPLAGVVTAARMSPRPAVSLEVRLGSGVGVPL